MDTIFKIEGIFVDRLSGNTWKYGYMLTNESIDKIKSDIIPKYIESANIAMGGNYIHHIVVTELPLDISVEDDEFVSEHTFLPNGELYISKEYRNLFGDSNFKGRNEDELPLKVGDKVEWFSNDGIYFGVIFSLPPRIGEFGQLDSFDDSYTVLAGFEELPDELADDMYMLSHQHIDVNCVFKRT